MKNLLKETIENLETNGKLTTDVLWVGNKDIYTTWEDFASKANFDYDNGYGGNKIASDLKIVGKDFWLERAEYDGSEWWEYKEFPAKPGVTRKLKNVENIDYKNKIVFYEGNSV